MAARVILEVGTHSAWVREVVVGCGHEVLVANPRLMDGTKRRQRKNDRIDANQLARVGRVDGKPGRAGSPHAAGTLYASKKQLAHIDAAAPPGGMRKGGFSGAL
jgi:hypothetical protein